MKVLAARQGRAGGSASAGKHAAAPGAAATGTGGERPTGPPLSLCRAAHPAGFSGAHWLPSATSWCEPAAAGRAPRAGAPGPLAAAAGPRPGGCPTWKTPAPLREARFIAGRARNVEGAQAVVGRRWALSALGRLQAARGSVSGDPWAGQTGLASLGAPRAQRMTNAAVPPGGFRARPFPPASSLAAGMPGQHGGATCWSSRHSRRIAARSAAVGAGAGAGGRSRGLQQHTALDESGGRNQMRLGE